MGSNPTTEMAGPDYVSKARSACGLNPVVGRRERGYRPRAQKRGRGATRDRMAGRPGERRRQMILTGTLRASSAPSLRAALSPGASSALPDPASHVLSRRSRVGDPDPIGRPAAAVAEGPRGDPPGEAYAGRVGTRARRRACPDRRSGYIEHMGALEKTSKTCARCRPRNWRRPRR